MLRIILCAAVAVLAAAETGRAQVVQFNLAGAGGPGLLGSNEAPTPVMGGGSGGEIGAGITYNVATNVLTVNVGWGSGNGFTNLTGNATVGHIHGPTPSVAPASFTEAVGVRYNFHTEPGWNPNAVNGAFIGTINIVPVDEPGLFEGRFYINIHTSVNPGGEIRGQLLPVPEPSSLILAGALVAGAFWRRRLPKR
jgi:hypothetical protein